MAIVTDLLGDNVIAWGSHFFCKMPRDGKTVSWHQDASYWPLTPSHAVTVWLAIDDADRGNACMKFIPGSHRYGHLTYKMSEDSESNILDQTVENAEGIGQPVYDELQAGECSIHSDLLLHGSEANNSDRRRCGLTLRVLFGRRGGRPGLVREGHLGERPGGAGDVGQSCATRSRLITRRAALDHDRRALAGYAPIPAGRSRDRRRRREASFRSSCRWS